MERRENLISAAEGDGIQNLLLAVTEHQIHAEASEMFLKYGRAIFYVSLSTDAVIEGIFNDLGTRFIKAGGSLFPMWAIAPKRIKVLEYILDNPRASVNSIASSLLYSYKQEVSDTISLLSRPTIYLIYREESSKYSVVPDKAEEVRKFIEDYRNKAVFEPELVKLEG